MTHTQMPTGSSPILDTTTLAEESPKRTISRSLISQSSEPHDTPASPCDITPQNLIIPPFTMSDPSYTDFQRSPERYYVGTRASGVSAWIYFAKNNRQIHTRRSSELTPSSNPLRTSYKRTLSETIIPLGSPLPVASSVTGLGYPTTRPLFALPGDCMSSTSYSAEASVKVTSEQSHPITSIYTDAPNAAWLPEEASPYVMDERRGVVTKRARRDSDCYECTIRRSKVSPNSQCLRG